MSTFKFKKQMGKKQEFKKEAPGFFDRWVHGTGGHKDSAGVFTHLLCPRLEHAAQGLCKRSARICRE
jgi:hypothetical protein